MVSKFHCHQYNEATRGKLFCFGFNHEIQLWDHGFSQHVAVQNGPTCRSPYLPIRYRLGGNFAPPRVVFQLVVQLLALPPSAGDMQKFSRRLAVRLRSSGLLHCDTSALFF